ncbi:MAG: hypothetical protein JW991_05055 [Candidatus Pacebacteria bacterium]|nr:hypothetical protein [Candidatus Paceibacterota bacterium]
MAIQESRLPKGAMPEPEEAGKDFIPPAGEGSEPLAGGLPFPNQTPEPPFSAGRGGGSANHDSRLDALPPGGVTADLLNEPLMDLLRPPEAGIGTGPAERKAKKGGGGNIYNAIGTSRRPPDQILQIGGAERREKRYDFFSGRVYYVVTYRDLSGYHTRIEWQ